MKRIFPAIIAGLLVSVPLLTVGARAATESGACMTAIRAANARHRQDQIPDDCWRLGPLTLGMTRDAAERAVGAPDVVRDVAFRYRGRRFTGVEATYAYPRNLKNWLRLAPQRAENFHPTTLQLFYWNKALVAITAGQRASIAAGACKAERAVLLRKPESFPYDFHGIRLGGPMVNITTRFGRFATTNMRDGLSTYWPVPIAVRGGAALDEISIATGMAFANRTTAPRFQLQRNPRSCLVTGYGLAPGSSPRL